MPLESSPAIFQLLSAAVKVKHAQKPVRMGENIGVPT